MCLDIKKKRKMEKKENGVGVGGGKYIYIYEEIIVQGDKYKREGNINIK